MPLGCAHAPAPGPIAGGRSRPSTISSTAASAPLRCPSTDAPARLGTLRDPGALPGWVCALARNAARDRLRARKRCARSQALVPDSVPARPEPRDDRELRTRVLARLDEIPETYREALILRLVEGLDGPAIAEHLGLTSGSVRVHLHRGLALLRPLLRKEGW